MFSFSSFRLPVAIGVLTALVVLAGVSAASGAPSRPDAIAIPRASGPYAVGTTISALTDPSRREPFIRASRPRSIVVQFWYPTARTRGTRAAYVSPAVAKQVAEGIPGAYKALSQARVHAFANAPTLRRKGGWPVVLFSPGYGVERQLYTGLVEDLASRGFVVIAIDHPEDANVVRFPDGRTVIRTNVPETKATIDKALATRVADVHFLLDQLEDRPRIAPAGPSRADLDLTRIGMFGHSLGGATAANAMLTDPRIDAGADLDGTIYGAAAHSSLTRPFMILAGTPGPLREKGMRRFFLHLRGPRFAVTFRRARHFAFSDLVFLLPRLALHVPELKGVVRALLGRVEPAPTLARQRRYLTAFFDRFLKGRSGLPLPS
jgi:predicted dienelactone hydrolase